MGKVRLYINFLAILCIVFSCRKKQPEKLFLLKKSAETGITFQNRLTEETAFNILNYPYYYNGGGVSIGDFDNDGLVDIYFVSNLGENKLYRNRGNLKFIDVTAKAGVGGQYNWSTGSNMVDINGDGLLDIYVCNLGRFEDREGKNELFLNNGDGTFTESAKTFNLDLKTFATQSCFFDYDNDGDLDVYLLNHAIHTIKAYVPRAMVKDQIDLMSGDKFMRNNLNQGKKTFTDITSSIGISSNPIGFGLGVMASDVDKDGWMDLYVANDFHEEDYLYMNTGNNSFLNKRSEWIGHTSKYSMGLDINDFNNDGSPDIITLDMLPDNPEVLQKSISEDDYQLRETILGKGYAPQLSRNNLQLNRGGYFSEIAPFMGIEATDWSWAPLFADLDNDGYKDLYITNGIYRRPNDLDYLNYTSNTAVQAVIGQKNPVLSEKLIQSMPQLKIPNKAFQNKSGISFEDIGKIWGLDIPSYSNGAAYADLDNDGDLDLVMNNINEEAFIFENRTNESLSSNAYLNILLKGKLLNSTGIGAKVFIKNKGKSYYQEHLPTRGFMSSMEQGVHFGINQSKQIDSLWVVWPGGSFQLMTNVLTNQTITIDEQDASGHYYKHEHTSGPTIKSLFAESGFSDFIVKHDEDSFSDIDVQFLLQKSIATEGPGLAVGDVNDDGLDDFFITNSKNNSPHLYVQSKDGSFKASNTKIFERDSIHEGVDALFFDADQDTDLDLYVASAGNEFAQGSAELSDRLYINDGNGNFRRDKNALPPLSGNTSCVEAADFDKDGDLDLFIGSRVISGKYGHSPESYILENVGKGKFEKAPLSMEISNMGMVTDASWTDYDGDGWSDLVVVGEWMPIMLIQNKKGAFTHSSLETIKDTEGWWNTLLTEDFDDDGDIDFMIGNVGLNTRLRPSIKEPVRLYLKDFDGNGNLDQIMTYYLDGEEYPFATKNVLDKQLNFLKKRFTSYSAFSGTTLQKLLSPKELESVTVKIAKEFKSIYLENKGKATFRRHELPIEANFSSVMAIAAMDVNMDGLKDVVFSGNFHNFNPGMGRQDANRGTVLLNKGSGIFFPISAEQSGLNIKGQAKKMGWLNFSDGKRGLLIGKNNERPQLLKLNE